ncbi:hypothetical protein [Konateibacter massiliensis]|uniref:hypothetical protein n=1 Tax=Konateibacter massiliensis TaxID=2002841 RepID=UPI000C154BB4|nr:hypothetical protein [Konateibacter massiliensis]
MAGNAKDFLVSTADVAFFHNDVLAFTGTTSLNTSINVSNEDQEITGGKGGKTLYKYKYGRKLASSIEMAEWNLAYIAANVGSTISEGLKDVYAVAECVTLVNGLGTLAKIPTGKVFVEKTDGSTSEVEPVGSTITVGNDNDTIKVTYQYNTNVKRVTIDAETSPLVGRLVLSADKHNSKKGKVGEVQIEIPSFQLSGNFDITLEATGSTTTNLDGDALAVEGDTCSDGSVYAYITEIPSNETSVIVSDIAATPATISLVVDGTKSISIIGIKGGLYSNVGIDVADCTITSDDPTVATVSAGVITGISAGNTLINIDYNGVKDVIKVTVE